MRAAVLAAATAVLAGCGGARPAPAPIVASHAPAAFALELSRDLPGGNFALFGGDYAKLQQLMVGWSAAVTGQAAAAEPLGSWMACLSTLDPQRQLAGAALREGRAEVRYVVKGVSLPELAGCARRAGLGATIDADGRYLAIELPIAGHRLTMGHLLLPDGALYSRLDFLPSGAMPDRAALEADAAARAVHSAADDSELVALAGQVDRSRTGWAVVQGASSPFAGKLDSLLGTFDLDGKLAIDLTIHLANEQIARMIEAQLRAVREDPGHSAESRAALAGVTLQRDGAQVHLAIHIGLDQASDLIAAFAPHRGPAQPIAQSIAKMGEFRNMMCGCQDAACAKQVAEQMTQWSMELAKQGPAPAKPTRDEIRQITEVTKQLTDCMRKATAASAAAGSASP